MSTQRPHKRDVAVFAALAFLPQLILWTPMSGDYLRLASGRIELGAALLAFVVLTLTYAKGRGQGHPSLLLHAGLVLAIAVVATVVLVLTTIDRFNWWGPELWWMVTMTAGLLCAWAGPWPDERTTLLTGSAYATLAVLAPLLMGWKIDTAYQMPLNALLVAIVVGIGLLIRQQRLRLAEQREAIQERERRILADELHDVIAHELTGIVVLTQALRGTVAAPETERALAQIQDTGARALAHIRALVTTTRTTDRAPRTPLLGSLADIDSLVEEFRRTTEATVTFTPPSGDLPAPVLIAAHRVLSEALTNVRRHAAHATAVDVSLVVEDGELVVTVDDNGGGGGLGTGGGTGLAGVRERAAMVGGSAAAGPQGKGWRVRARLPLRGSGR